MNSVTPAHIFVSQRTAYINLSLSIDHFEPFLSLPFSSNNCGTYSDIESNFFRSVTCNCMVFTSKCIHVEDTALT